MTLNQIEERTKEENGIKYTANIYTLGDNYRVERYRTTYADGNTNLIIYVIPNREKKYIPEIYYRRNFFGTEKTFFEIQTTSYGALETEEIKKVIAGYQEALEAAEILNRRFC